MKNGQNTPETTENVKTGSTGEGARECGRCGTCCRKGGPSFHHEDRELIDKGLIPSSHLYTIREGELAHDNVRQTIKPVDSDIIKIKGKDDTWMCRFLNEAENSCTIYANRPLECRVLQCWDTKEIERVYAENRLTREDLISEVEGLWGLVADHQKRCDYRIIGKLAKNIDSDKHSNAQQKLAEIIQYDIEIRNLVTEKGGLGPDMLDFLFGRPLVKTIENFGFRVQRDGKKLILKRLANWPKKSGI